MLGREAQSEARQGQGAVCVAGFAFCFDLLTHAVCCLLPAVLLPPQL